MITREQSMKLGRVFKVVAVTLVGYAVYKATQVPAAHAAAAILIGVVALVPGLIWSRGRTGGGLPVFPIFAASNVWTGCLPTLNGSFVGGKYSDGQVLLGAGVVAAFVGTGTVFWFRAACRPTTPPQEFTGFPATGSALPYFGFLLLACLFHTSLFWQLIPDLPGSWYGTVRTAGLGMSTLSACVLAYRWGVGLLTPAQKVLFAALAGAFCLLETAGLMIHGAASLLFICYAVYTLGSGRIPVALVAATFVLVTLLHLGKWPLRAQYWKNGPGSVVLQEDLASLYGRWIGYGLDAVASGPTDKPDKGGEAMNRASTLQMVCLVTDRSPDPVPFFAGETYLIIPELLIPRPLHPDKPWSHEGTYILSIGYGLQTRAATRQTTIGFGPVAEAYANFGLPGVLLIGAAFGHLLALAAGRGRGLPLTAFENLLALLAMSCALQTESCAAMIVTSFFQSWMLLVAVSFLMMRRQPAGAGE